MQDCLWRRQLCRARILSGEKEKRRWYTSNGRIRHNAWQRRRDNKNEVMFERVSEEVGICHIYPSSFTYHVHFQIWSLVTSPSFWIPDNACSFFLRLLKPASNKILKQYLRRQEYFRRIKMANQNVIWSGSKAWKLLLNNRLYLTLSMPVSHPHRFLYYC